MDVFYPEYALFLIFIVLAAWRILKDVPDGDERRRRLTRDGMSNNEKKSKET
jgi:hypothetical protein